MIGLRLIRSLGCRRVHCLFCKQSEQSCLRLRCLGKGTKPYPRPSPGSLYPWWKPFCMNVISRLCLHSSTASCSAPGFALIGKRLDLNSGTSGCFPFLCPPYLSVLPQCLFLPSDWDLLVVIMFTLKLGTKIA